MVQKLKTKIGTARYCLVKTIASVLTVIAAVIAVRVYYDKNAVELAIIIGFFYVAANVIAPIFTGQCFLIQKRRE